MTRIVEAIYEDGVLRPVEALDLAEHERVELTVRSIENEQIAVDADSWPKMEATASGRLAALEQFFKEVDEMDLHLAPLPTREELHERR